ncbi:ATP-binding cassette [Lithospermum erythrorhizon]|uniref:ATP-binding cassette n=1 Tax=Lithospermum erythrorhizon TaxID=34254 RepID=A0AAV3RQU3_LITER
MTVAEDGSNWSMAQRQLFCLGHALLRRSNILVLDEPTVSIDNASSALDPKDKYASFDVEKILELTKRIPTVMDCIMVLGISDGKIVDYDDPKLIKKEASLFAKHVHEY